MNTIQSVGRGIKGSGALNVIGSGTGISICSLLHNTTDTFEAWKSAYYNLPGVPVGPAREPKYKFSRTNWYYVTNVSVLNVTWCVEQFGPRIVYPDAWSRWEYKWGLIKFRDEKDYAWYVLRWGV